MQGVTTALVLFIFACVAFPKMVRSKPQFYIAVALTAVIIVLDGLRFMVTNAGADTRPGGLGVVLYVMVSLAQFLAFTALILGSGGLSMKELADDMAGAFEVVRRGEDADRPTIVPLSGGKRRQAAGEEPERVVYTINSPEVPGTAARPGANDPIPLDEDEDGPIPFPSSPPDAAAPVVPATPPATSPEVAPAPPPAPPDRRTDTNLPQ